jgi:L-galactono-1,4-lactone dehydrogenase
MRRFSPRFLGWGGQRFHFVRHPSSSARRGGASASAVATIRRGDGYNNNDYHNHHYHHYSRNFNFFFLPGGRQTSLLAVIAAATTTSVAAVITGGISPTLAEEKPIEEEEESTTILNWSGTHSVALPPGTYHEPKTITELINLVSNSYRHNNDGQQPHIRPVGSALSPNGVAFDSRGMISLTNLDKIININKKDMTVTCQSGARVSQVLDALRPHGLTLPNLASIAEQQIGGFVSVGAHGTGALIPPCDEFVTGLTMVTPSEHGVVTMTESTHGELFRLARLGLGGLGILTEVTLKVVPAHRLVEQTRVLSRLEAKKQLPALLKRHKHVRYMWIPYEDCVVVVTNDDENDLPLLGPGTEIHDQGSGKKKKIVTAKDIQPMFTREEQLSPLRDLLRQLLLENKNDDATSSLVDDDTMNGMGFGDLRDVILASGNMLDPDHVKRCNKAEREFWSKAVGVDLAPSDQKLQFDCGGQQLVYEVCFRSGTYGMPGTSSIDFMESLLKEIETAGLPAPAPIEQRWTSGSKSPLSPASVVGPQGNKAYDSNNALFSWVGVIMYLPSEDFDPTGYRRQFISDYFKDVYCKVVRRVGEKYNIMCHWAKLEVSEDPTDSNGEVAASVREHFGPTVIDAFNAARDKYDPKRILSSSMIDQIFGSKQSK